MPSKSSRQAYRRRAANNVLTGGGPEGDAHVPLAEEVVPGVSRATGRPMGREARLEMRERKKKKPEGKKPHKERN